MSPWVADSLQSFLIPHLQELMVYKWHETECAAEEMYISVADTTYIYMISRKGIEYTTYLADKTRCMCCR